MLNDLQAKVAGAKDTVQAKVSGAKDSVFQAVDEVQTRVESELLELRSQLKSQADAFNEERKQLVAKIENAARNQVREVVIKHAKSVTDRVMDAILPAVKNGAKDPDMPKSIQSFIDEMIDSVWPDFKEEALEGLFCAVKVFDVQHGQPPICYPYNPVAFVRYVMQPYDKSAMAKMKHPMWWIILLIALIPRYAIGQIEYILLFLTVDWNDEYQLVQYIMGFKAIQFLNLGIVSSLVGAGQYYVCIVQTNTSCENYAPVEKPYTLLVFIIQILITYLAFLMIPCSQKKGGATYQLQAEDWSQVRELCATEEGQQKYWSKIFDGGETFSESIRRRGAEEDASSSRSRSRFNKLMIYDVCVFLICAGLLAWGLFANQLSSDANISSAKGDTLANVNWRVGMLLYWIKVFYGMLSFPFFIMQLPLISSMLVHVRPTAYNPWGVTVPLRGKEDPNAPNWVATQTAVESA